MRVLVYSLVIILIGSLGYSAPLPVIDILQYYGDGCLGHTDDPWSFIQTQDDGFLLAGFTGRFHPGWSQAWFAHIDGVGNLLWEYAYGYYDYANTVLQTANGDFVAAGWSDPTGYSEFMLMKVSAFGDSVWMRRYPDAQGAAYGMVQTRDGGFVLSGHVYHMSGTDAYLMKTDSSGNMLWNKTYDLGGSERFIKVAACRDEGFILAGRLNVEINGPVNLFVIRTDAYGDTLWSRIYDKPSDQYYSDIKVLNDGASIIVGEDCPSRFENGNSFITKLSDSGDIVWWQTFGSPDSSEAPRMVVPVNDGFLLAGSSVFYSPFSASYFAKTDTAGSLLWHRAFAPLYHSGLTGIIPLSNGRYALAGFACCRIGNTVLAPDGFFVLTGVDESVNVGAPESPNPLPTEFGLAVYPNPFNSITTIRIDTPSSQIVRIALFDLTGRLIETFNESRLKAGANTITMDGQKLSSGIYFINAVGEGMSKSVKLVLLK